MVLCVRRSPLLNMFFSSLLFSAFYPPARTSIMSVYALYSPQRPCPLTTVVLTGPSHIIAVAVHTNIVYAYNVYRYRVNLTYTPRTQYKLQLAYNVIYLYVCTPQKRNTASDGEGGAIVYPVAKIEKRLTTTMTSRQYRYTYMQI